MKNTVVILLFFISTLLASAQHHLPDDMSDTEKACFEKLIATLGKQSADVLCDLLFGEFYAQANSAQQKLLSTLRNELFKECDDLVQPAELSVRFSPNPADGILSLTATLPQGQYQIQLIDKSSNEVLRESIGWNKMQSEYTIEIRHLPAGMYVCILTGNNIKHTSVMIKR